MKIHVSVDTRATADEVLEAVTDFSDRRAEIWPNLDPEKFEVHELGTGWAEVTEGSSRPDIWARERYDWSQPGRVSWTVLDSNFCKPPSGITMVIEPGRDGGSHLEIDWERTPANARGRMLVGLMSLVGRRVLEASFRGPLDAFAEPH